MTEHISTDGTTTAPPRRGRAAVPLPFIQNTKEWEEARRDTIGASDLPIITGSTPFAGLSAFALWAWMTRRTDKVPVDEMTQERFDLGHAMEPVIAERYAILTGRKVRRVRQTLQHPDIPWATASLDRVDAAKGARRIVELKWDPFSRMDKYDETVPPYVQEQVQWQLFVTGYDVADVAILAGGHVEYHEVEPDVAFQDNLLFIAQRFWEDNIVKGEKPEIDGSEATRKALLRMHPNDAGTLMAPTAELEALMNELHEAVPAEKEAIGHVRTLKNAIRSALGDSAGSEAEGWRISHRRSKDGSKTDWQALGAHYRSMLAGIYEDTATDLDGLIGRLDEVEKRHTAVTEGSRRLLAAWPKGEGKWT